jgi:hypothetical protein
METAATHELEEKMENDVLLVAQVSQEDLEREELRVE